MESLEPSGATATPWGLRPVLTEAAEQVHTPLGGHLVQHDVALKRVRADDAAPRTIEKSPTSRSG